MKQIKSFKRKDLRNGEYLSYNREIEEAILSESAEKLRIVDYFTGYRQKLQTFDDCIMRVRGSMITEEMRIADKDRDKLVVGIAEQIRSDRRHFDLVKQQAANDLVPVLNSFRRIYKKNYNEETGFIIDLVKTYRMEPHATNIAILGLTEWVDRLEAANMECIALTSSRTYEEVRKKKAGRARDARNLLDEEYRRMIDQLNALAKVFGDDIYADLFDYINGRILHYRTVLARRHGERAARFAYRKDIKE